MRVLLPIHSYPPFHRAGAENYAAQLACDLAVRDEVYVASTRRILSLPSGTVDRYVHDGVDVFEVANNVDYDGIEETWHNPGMERAFEWILDEVKPDVVHFQHLLYWSARLPALVKKRGLPCLMTLHDFWLGCARWQLIDFRGELCRGPSPERCPACMSATAYGQTALARRGILGLQALRRRSGLALDEPARRLYAIAQRLRSKNDSRPRPADDLERWERSYERRVEAFRSVLDSVDLFVTSSNDLLDRLVSWGAPADRMRYLPHGIDPGSLAGAREARSSTGPLRLGFLGTLAEHKAPDILIRAMAGFDRSEVRLTIWGPEYQEPRYARYCRELAANLDTVEFGGFLDREGVRDALSKIDALCVPSIWYECSPVTILEAQLARVPCIVSDLGGMADMVRDGVDGLVAAPGEPDDWRRVIRDLVDDRPRVEELASRAPTVMSAAENAERIRDLWRVAGRVAGDR